MLGSAARESALHRTDENHVWWRASARGLLVLTKPHDRKAATPGDGTMLALSALSAPSHAKVREVHPHARKRGATNEGDPGYRTAPFFGAYFRDPDGNKLCVLAMTEG